MEPHKNKYLSTQILAAEENLEKKYFSKEIESLEKDREDRIRSLLHEPLASPELTEKPKPATGITRLADLN